ncbi:MAG TPA: SpoIIE family protein phosphatase, partial [Vicinamibacterales bacterium]|nr:SpoIIE family protein phosphatase [Vicinamibacterales bacterium]
PPLIRRRDGRFDRLHGTGIALGLFEHSEYTAAQTRLEPGDLLVFYSDGITEAEDPAGQPLERVRAIRDDIRQRVHTLVTREGVGATL